MDFFSKLNDKVKVGWEKVKVGWEKTKTAVKEIAHEVKEAFQPLVDNAVKIYHKVETKLKEAANNVMDSVLPKPGKGYVPSIKEEKKAKDISDAIKQNLPKGIDKSLQQQTPEERIESMQRIMNSTSKILELTNTPILEMFYTEPDEYGEAPLGGFDFRENKLYLNGTLICCESGSLIREQIFTIVHELFHAAQAQSVANYMQAKDSTIFNEDRILEYMENFSNIIPPRVSYREYCKQPIEHDAFGFENYIKDLLKNY